MYFQCSLSRRNAQKIILKKALIWVSGRRGREAPARSLRVSPRGSLRRPRQPGRREPGPLPSPSKTLQNYQSTKNKYQFYLTTFCDIFWIFPASWQQHHITTTKGKLIVFPARLDWSSQCYACLLPSTKRSLSQNLLMGKKLQSFAERCKTFPRSSIAWKGKRVLFKRNNRTNWKWKLHWICVTILHETSVICLSCIFQKEPF